MHSIQAAAEKSGLTADVIRVWERRYQAIAPERTPSNQRVYSNEDVYRLVLLRKATEGGNRISSVANLATDELEKIVSDLEIASEVATEAATQETLSHNYLELCLNDILMLNPRPFERHLQQALVEMGLVAFLKDLIHPLMFKVGTLWQKGNMRTCQEHFASAGVRSFLGRYLVDGNTDEQGPRLIIATPSHHSHELGAIIAGVLAATRGWQVVYLGPNVPVEEVIFAADCKAAKAVALSLSFPVLDPSIPEYLRHLRNGLAENANILIGGASYPSYMDTLIEIKAECSDSLESFIDILDKLHSR